MSTDKVKEWREWGTFLMSFGAMVAIPIGMLILSNQRMQIERLISDTYESKAAHVEDRNRLEDADKAQWRGVSEIKAQLGDVLTRQIRTEDNIAVIKDSLDRQERSKHL